MRRCATILGSAMLALLLAGVPASSALEDQQLASLQRAATLGGSALRAAVSEIAVAELAAGRPASDVAADLGSALYELGATAEVRAENMLVLTVALAEAADRVPAAGITPAAAAEAATVVALRFAANSPAYLRALVAQAAAEAATGTSPYAGYVETAFAAALTSPLVPAAVRESARQLAADTGLAGGTVTTAEGNEDHGGTQGGGHGGAFGGLTGGLLGIPGTVSADRSASPN